MKDINVEAMNNAVEIANTEADAKVASMQADIEGIREESRAIGILQKINYDTAHNELLKYVTLFQIRQSKEYKKGGMTWDQFCEAIGEQRRNVDRVLKDIEPIYNNFSDNLSHLIDLPFNKIRYLGKNLTKKTDNLSEIENGILTIDNTPIPLTPDNKDDIEAAIDTMIESHKREKKELKNKLAYAKAETKRAVSEETKGLALERDTLVKEVDRLKKFEPQEKDRDWAVQQMAEITDTILNLASQCQTIVMAEQIETDRHLQAQVEAKITEAEGYLQDIRRTWTDRFVDPV